jgi:hypothetical protein
MRRWNYFEFNISNCEWIIKSVQNSLNEKFHTMKTLFQLQLAVGCSPFKSHESIDCLTAPFLTLPSRLHAYIVWWKNGDYANVQGLGLVVITKSVCKYHTSLGRRRRCETWFYDEPHVRFPSRVQTSKQVPTLVYFVWYGSWVYVLDNWLEHFTES